MSKEKIINKIKKGEVKMKPKVYFALASFILGLGISGVVILQIFISNFIFHRIKTIQDFGMRRPPMFLKFFPWELLLLSLGLVILGVYLYKKYEFSYKKGLLQIILAFVLGTVLIGFGMHKSGFNDKLARKPGFGRFYETIERRKGMCQLNPERCQDILGERKPRPQMYYRQYESFPRR
ncbi:hypothetical protein ACFL13_01985 [Patescibacteria group bacterium]